MKALFTLTLILIFSANALAQNTDANEQLKADTVDTALFAGDKIGDDKKEVEADNGKTIARLYRSKNSLVKKELQFRTKRNRAKLS